MFNKEVGIKCETKSIEIIEHRTHGKVTNIRNAKVGQGGLSQLIEGYFNIINGLFYFDRDS